MRLESEINKHIVHKLEQERDMYKRNWDKTLKQRNQYKAERDTLIDDIAVLRANISRLEQEKKDLHLQMNTYFDEWQELKQWYQMHKECADAVYEQKVKLERELAAALNGELATYDELQKYVLELQSDLMEYQKENEKLNNVANEAMDLVESENEKYVKLTQHIRQKAESNPNVDRYIALVNYIDRLERE